MGSFIVSSARVLEQGAFYSPFAIATMSHENSAAKSNQFNAIFIQVAHPLRRAAQRDAASTSSTSGQICFIADQAGEFPMAHRAIPPPRRARGKRELELSPPPSALRTSGQRQDQQSYRRRTRIYCARPHRGEASRHRKRARLSTEYALAHEICVTVKRYLLDVLF